VIDHDVHGREAADRVGIEGGPPPVEALGVERMIGTPSEEVGTQLRSPDPVGAVLVGSVPQLP